MAAQFQHTLDNLSKVMDEALIAEKAKSKFLGKMSHELKTPFKRNYWLYSDYAARFCYYDRTA